MNPGNYLRPRVWAKCRKKEYLCGVSLGSTNFLRPLYLYTKLEKLSAQAGAQGNRNKIHPTHVAAFELKGHKEGDEKGDEEGDKKGDEKGDKKGDEEGDEKGDEEGDKKGDEGDKKGDEKGDEEGDKEGDKKADEIGDEKGDEEGDKKGDEEGDKKSDEKGDKKEYKPPCITCQRFFLKFRSSPIIGNCAEYDVIGKVEIGKDLPTKQWGEFKSACQQHLCAFNTMESDIGNEMPPEEIIKRYFESTRDPMKPKVLRYQWSAETMGGFKVIAKDWVYQSRK